MIGNAFPPKFAEHHARAIYAHSSMSARNNSIELNYSAARTNDRAAVWLHASCHLETSQSVGTIGPTLSFHTPKPPRTFQSVILQRHNVSLVPMQIPIEFRIPET